jgi:hypothetical protein
LENGSSKKYSVKQERKVNAGRPKKNKFAEALRNDQANECNVPPQTIKLSPETEQTDPTRSGELGP